MWGCTCFQWDDIKFVACCEFYVHIVRPLVSFILFLFVSQQAFLHKAVFVVHNQISIQNAAY